MTRNDVMVHGTTFLVTSKCDIYISVVVGTFLQEMTWKFSLSSAEIPVTAESYQQ